MSLYEFLLRHLQNGGEGCVVLLNFDVGEQIECGLGAVGT